ncbi:DUF975 family protein [Laceyella putida]|uniref:DUF975 family protein n=1 Tax=Laceyella putida TaxID=110101 RepID=A0ABW2RLK5_9BACL
MKTRRQLKQEARNALKGNWGLGVAITLFVFIASVFLEFFPPYSTEVHYEVQTTWKDLASPLWLYLVVSALTIGEVKVFLQLSRYERTRFSDIFTFFTSGRQYFRAVGAYFFTILYTLLWSLLLIIPGIIKAYSYSMTYYLINDDPNLSIHQAITKSRQMMDGHKWKYFVLQLSFIGWALLGILTLGIGFLWIAPYMSATSAQFYLNLRNQAEPAPVQE